MVTIRKRQLLRIVWTYLYNTTQKLKIQANKAIFLKLLCNNVIILQIYIKGGNYNMNNKEKLVTIINANIIGIVITFICAIAILLTYNVSLLMFSDKENLIKSIRIIIYILYAISITLISFKTYIIIKN